MTSTVLDATLALLLISAAVGTVVTTSASNGDDHLGRSQRADRTLETLATSTAEVNYTLAPGAEQSGETPVRFERKRGPGFQRTAHGTYAELLARSALATLEIDGQRVTRTGTDFRRAVRAATREHATDPEWTDRSSTGQPSTDRPSSGVQVVALWRPYPGAPIQSRLRVGPSAPRDARVHAASLTVPSGYPTTRASAVDAAERGGFARVARVVAAGIVEGTFPPRTASFALHGDYPVAALVADRYYRFGALVGGDVREPIASADARGANEALTEALAERIKRDLRATYETPHAAARAVRIDRVRIGVRTWSP